MRLFAREYYKWDSSRCVVIDMLERSQASQTSQSRLKLVTRQPIPKTVCLSDRVEGTVSEPHRILYPDVRISHFTTIPMHGKIAAPNFWFHDRRGA